MKGRSLWKTGSRWLSRAGLALAVVALVAMLPATAAGVQTAALARLPGGQVVGGDPDQPAASSTVRLPIVFKRYPPCFRLATVVDPAGSGTVDALPAPNCRGSEYEPGTSVALTATPAQGWAFAGWSGDLTGSDNPASILLDADRTVTAHFVREEYRLDVELDGQGTVTRDPDLATYPFESVVALLAMPDPGWAFVGWSGDLAGGANPAGLVMDGPKAVTAHFGQGTVGPVVYAGHTIDDDWRGASRGDGDGVLECGERIELAVDLHNQGDLLALGVRAGAVSADAYVTWQQPQSAYPDLPAGSIDRGEPFVLSVDRSTPDGHVFTVTLAITATNGASWTDAFSLPVTCVEEPPPERVWDPRLDALGVTLEPAAVTPGEPYWRLVEGRWADEEGVGGPAPHLSRGPGSFRRSRRGPDSGRRLG
jgi:uncharacterized repeat protein (TIGR02543 family)